MADVLKEEADHLMTLRELIEATAYKTGRQKLPCCPQTIPVELQLKWGLTLLGDEKARQYLEWVQIRLGSSSQ
jgi:hypothetical protein